MTKRIGVIVVAFNRAPDRIPLLSSGLLASDRDVVLVVCDNSDSPNIELAKWCAKNGAEYVAMGGNRGLPIAYKAGIARLRGLVEFVCFVDHDTEVPQGYFDRFREYLTCTRGDVYMPAVYAGELLISPCRRWGPHYSRLRRNGVLPRHFSCINSGLIVRMAVLDRAQFDEGLFLDYVDHAFVRAMQRSGVAFVAMWDNVLGQAYSRSTDSLGQALVRFDIFRRDMSHFYERTLALRLYGWMLVFRRAVRAGLDYRSFEFVVRLASVARDRAPGADAARKGVA